jgi:hypothetical protein
MANGGEPPAQQQNPSPLRSKDGKMVLFNAKHVVVRGFADDVDDSTRLDGRR